MGLLWERPLEIGQSRRENSIKMDFGSKMGEFGLDPFGSGWENAMHINTVFDHVVV